MKSAEKWGDAGVVVRLHEEASAEDRVVAGMRAMTEGLSESHLDEWS